MRRTDELTIKGTRNGLEIALPEYGALDDQLQLLETRLQATASFFRGGRVALQVGQRDLSREEIEQIGVLLSGQGVSLWSIFSESEETRQAAEELGLETAPGRAKVALPPVSPYDSTGIDRADTAVFVTRTLRSGQKIEHPGHVIIIGDVNPGAEIVAGGNVLVWGKLRGTVHAGASGNNRAFVCALSLFPTQLRIGNHITRSPDIRPPRRNVPEIATVQNGEIVAELWDGG